MIEIKGALKLALANQPLSSQPNRIESWRPDCPRCLQMGILTSSGLSAADVMTMPDDEALSIADQLFCDCPSGVVARRLRERRLENARRFTEETNVAIEAARKRQADALWAASGVPARYRDFTLKSYVAAAHGDPGKTSVIVAATEMARTGLVTTTTGQKRRSLVLYGDRGVGKTGALAPIFMQFERAGRDCLWLPFLSLMSQVRAGYDTGEAQARVDRAIRADVLLIDDLGQSDRTEESGHTRAILFEIIYYRHGEDRTTLITTNLEPARLSAQISPEFYQRVMEMALIVHVGGATMRSLT